MAGLVTTAALLWLAGFGLSVYLVEKLPGLSPRLEAVAEDGGGLFGPALTVPRGQRAVMTPAPACVGAPLASGDLLPAAESPRIFAHFLPWSPEALAGVGQACGHIGTVLPELFRLDRDSARIAALMPEADPARLRMALGLTNTTTAIMPVVLMDLGARAATDAPILDDPALRDRIVQDLAGQSARHGFAGLCLQPYNLSAADVPGLAALLSDLSVGLSGAALSCLVSGADDDLWRDPALVAAADRVVLRAFRDLDTSALPQPLAPQAWFAALIDAAVDTISADKLIVALGGFGYDWVSGYATPVPITYAEAMHLAARPGGRIDLAPEMLNTKIAAVDAARRLHRIWMLDAVSAHNQLAILAQHEVAGVALWSVGGEDPGLWPLLDRKGAIAAGTLEQVSLAEDVIYEGIGPLYRLASGAVAGKRDLLRDPDSGLITGQNYTRIPQPHVIERFGPPGADEIVLSFDDGPDARFTPAILDILRDKQATATFFLLGRNIIRHPEIARRIVAEGHEFGSHSFFHPDMARTTIARMQMELNALQRLLVSTTGRGTMLFRPPYGRSEGPLTAAEVRPLTVTDAAGYITAGGDIVPPDWTGLSAEQIVALVMAEVGTAGTGGKVIILHDAGGDRSATVAALPVLIDRLRAGGFRIVPMSALLGMERDQAMPPATGSTVTFDRYSFALLAQMGPWLASIFWIVVLVGLVRSVSMLALALWRGRRRPDPAVAGWTPPVTVLIPAYNEEKVIARSIAAVLASDYPDLRVIVIDDGSSDRTHEIALAAHGNDPRVQILRQPNQGKWAALNTAYSHVTTEIVVAIDADTMIARDAIRGLVPALRDPGVGAVAGNVKIGNQTRLLTLMQTLEYVTAQNIDRRAFERIGGVMVVPGAIGAWRVEAVRKAGLYSNATVAEDADLTVAVQRAGYRVLFAEDAIAVTEAPEGVAELMRQRLRWTFGMMQTAWKHRGAAREGRPVGLVALPDLALFGIGMGLLAPLADLVLLGLFADMVVSLTLGLPVLGSRLPALMLAGYLALPAMDIVVAATALRFERRETLLLILLIPLQRLIYRPLLYITVWRAVLRATTGQIAGWGKLARKGVAQLPGQ